MGPRTQSEVLGGFEGSANLYTLVKACMHTSRFNSELSSLPVEEEETDSAIRVWFFYLSPMCRCC